MSDELNMLDVVEVKRNLPDLGLWNGDQGTIVHVHEKPGKRAFEVEFPAAGERSEHRVVTVEERDLRPAITVPIIHLNGTSKQELLDNRMALHSALYDLEGLLARNAPNGRDYYPVGGLMANAQLQHQRRQYLLSALMRSVAAEIAAIDALP